MSDSRARCPRCGVDLAAGQESYTLWHWDPANRRSELVQAFCPEHRPIPAPEWIEREVKRNRS